MWWAQSAFWTRSQKMPVQVLNPCLIPLKTYWFLGPTTNVFGLSGLGVIWAWITVLSGYMPRSGTAGSYGDSIFCFLRKFHMFSTVAVPADVPFGFAFFGRIAKPGESECLWALELSSAHPAWRGHSPRATCIPLSLPHSECASPLPSPLHWHCLPGPPRHLSSHC